MKITKMHAIAKDLPNLFDAADANPKNPRNCGSITCEGLCEACSWDRVIEIETLRGDDDHNQSIIVVEEDCIGVGADWGVDLHNLGDTDAEKNVEESQWADNPQDPGYTNPWIEKAQEDAQEGAQEDAREDSEEDPEEAHYQYTSSMYEYEFGRIGY